MRVMMVTGAFPPMICGIGDYTQQLVLQLARNPDLQVAVVTDREAEASRQVIGYELLSIIENWEWRGFLALVRRIRAWAPDVVHIQYPGKTYINRPLPYLLPLSLRLAGIPVVQSWHELPTSFRTFAFFSASRFLFMGVVPGGLVVVREDYRARLPPLWRWVLCNKNVKVIGNASIIPPVRLSDSERHYVRVKHARPQAKLIVCFGFVHPGKRVDLLFQIADPDESHIVIAGWFQPENPYHQSLLRLADTDEWRGKVTITGFLLANDAASLLASADAVVLPFREGTGQWNTSTQAAQVQGTFLLTTSKCRSGYDIEENTYYAAPDDIPDMRKALKAYMGRRTKPEEAFAYKWRRVAESHVSLYRSLVM